MTWITIGDLQNGIEAFLLAGPQAMREICVHAAVRGVRDGLTIHNVHALRDAGRLEFDSEARTFTLSAWNRQALQRAGTPDQHETKEPSETIVELRNVGESGK